MSDRILVVGSSGLVGRNVVQMLEAENRSLVCATRHPATNRDVYFDLLKPASFARALEGVSTVMLISRPADEDAHVHAAPFVQAMRVRGVRRVVVLSALGAELRPDFSLRRVEILVEDSGMLWTHVRPNFFMQMLALPPLATEIAALGTLSLPLAGASVAYVDAFDVAAVVHRALIDESLSGHGITVSGPEPLDHDQIAASISQSIGRPVRYVQLGEATARELMLSRGFDARQVERVLTFYRLIRGGFCGKPDGCAAKLLGRPLRTWSDFLVRSRPAWRLT